MEMMVKGKPAFQLDSGASVNILNEKHVMGKTLEHSNKTLVMWNGAEVKPQGVPSQNYKPQNWTKICSQVCHCERGFPSFIGGKCNPEDGTHHGLR